MVLNPLKAQVLLEDDFENPLRGALTTDFRDHRNLEILDGVGVDGSRGLKARYVGYERGSQRIGSRFEIRRHGEEMTLNFDVKFDEDFQFVRGGKLHGLGPMSPVTGGNEMHPEGWSARIMFHEQGTIGTYIYYQDKESKWGRGKRAADFRFEKGRYHAVSLYVRLNDHPRERNGLVEIWVDGNLVVEHPDLLFRSRTGRNSRIHHFLFSTFHGGSSEEWAPVDEDGNFTTVHAYFDNFSVQVGKEIRQAPGNQVH